jgi:hypothetical protein
MSKIAVDVDSTLYDFETPAREAFAKLAERTGNKDYLRGAYHAWTEWRSPADICGTEAWLEAIALCHSEDVILAQTPFNGAVETCQALVDEGHELIYISNRAVESGEATHQWLQEWGFPLDKSIVEVDEWQEGHVLKVLTEDKAPFLRNCQYLIDDRPKTAIDFVYDYEWQYRFGLMHDPYTRIKRKAFLIAYPYNQALTDIPNLYLAPTWSGINQYLVSKGVLSAPAYHALGV